MPVAACIVNWQESVPGSTRDEPGAAGGARWRSPAPPRHTRVTPAVPDCTGHTVPETGNRPIYCPISTENSNALPLHDPAAATTPARDWRPIRERASTCPARALADSTAGSCRRPAIRQARPAATSTGHSRGHPVSGRTGRGSPQDRADLQTRTGADVAAAATAIAGLRWRLRRQSTLEHPAVRRELRQLDEQLTAQLDRSARPPGRHRFPAARPAGPDPATTRTPASPNR